MLRVLILGLPCLLVVATACVALVLTWRHRRRVAPSGGALAFQALPATTPPQRHGQAAAVGRNGCPVCGADLPGESPENLCPQCLMKCALSRPGPALADEEDAIPPLSPEMRTAPNPADLAQYFPELEILELLGQGGMGAVYKARQRKLDRMVALKVLPSEWGRDPAFAERFAREARTLARLNHAGVVSIHDFGEAGGQYFLIMEYVEGANLRQFLTAGRLQPWQALPIVTQVCDALQYAHEQGVVHRDVKPENILLDRHGRVKIADFGLAKLTHRSRSEYTLTGSRQVMGTVDYMAPEQRTTPQAVDHRADIYSLGVVFYEMLTGELPLGRFAAPSEKAPMDGRLDEVIFRALEREPNRRYQRISAVKADVESILRDDAWIPEPTRAVERGTPDLAMAQVQTRGPAAGLVVVALLMLIQGTLVGILALSAVASLRDPDGLTPVACLLLLVLGGLALLAVVGAVAAGAVKLGRCQAYEWVMFAVILVMLPLGYHCLLGLPIGIWAILVLRRPEVQAAFALNLRRAQREVAANHPAAPAWVAQPPADPQRRPVRAFVLSALSMFVPRSVLKRRTATPAAAPLPVLPFPVPAHQSVRPEKTRMKMLRAALFAAGAVFLLILAGAFMTCLFLAMRYDNSGRYAPASEYPTNPYPRANEGQLEGLQLEMRGELTRTLAFHGTQGEAITKIMQGADRDYLALEERHTQRKWVNQGRRTSNLHVTISPFPDQVSQLEDRVWAKLDSILDLDQREKAKKQLPGKGMLFAYGMTETHIEIWQEAPWMYWKVERTAAPGEKPAAVEEGNGAQLPLRYQRFWQGGAR